MQTIALNQAHKLIARREEFKTGGQLRGLRRITGTGALAPGTKERLLEDFDHVDYVVYSYATPIAWHTEKGWTVVAQRFSVTTTKHQNQVNLAVLEPEWVA